MPEKNTILGQMLQMFSRYEFAMAVKEKKQSGIPGDFLPGTILSPCFLASFPARIVCEGLKQALPLKRALSII